MTGKIKVDLTFTKYKLLKEMANELGMKPVFNNWVKPKEVKSDPAVDGQKEGENEEE